MLVYNFFERFIKNVMSMEFLNDLATEYQYLLSAIGSLATAFAVYLALRNHKPKPKIEVELNIDTKQCCISPNEQPEYNFICAEVINLDPMPIEIQINSFRSKRKQIIYPIDYKDNSGYTLPSEDIVYEYYIDKNISSWNPLGDDLKQYPFLIKSGESKKFFLFLEKEFIEEFSKAGFLKRTLIKMNLFCLFCKPRVVIYNKFIYRASLGTKLKTKIKKVVK